MMSLSGTIHWERHNGLIVNRDFLDILTRNRLNTFDRMFVYDGGEVVKDIGIRTVTRITLTIDGKVRHFYLKRHYTDKLWFQKRGSSFGGGGRLSQGLLEFDNICRFREANVSTPVPVAAGQRMIRWPRVQSFVVTEDFRPYISLEKLLETRPEFFLGAESKTRKRLLLKEIAELARRMHERGFNHRDFNGTHVLLCYDNEDRPPATALFDLQRIDRKRLFRFRWIIKSLAEMNYSLPESVFGLEDRQFLFLSYKNKIHPGLRDRLEMFWIRRKTERIRRHTRNLIKRRDRLRDPGSKRPERGRPGEGWSARG